MNKQKYWVQDGMLCAEVFAGVWGPTGLSLYITAKTPVSRAAASSWVEMHILTQDFDARVFHSKKDILGALSRA